VKTKKWTDFQRERHTPEEIEEAKTEAANELKLLDLQHLRKLAGQRQVEVAEKLHISQAELSRLERRVNPTLATLHRFVEALGGKLTFVVELGNVSVGLKGRWAEAAEIPAPEIIDAHRKRKASGRRKHAGS
jgi:transcriptional regulator with XRE-family HTH domain